MRSNMPQILARLGPCESGRRHAGDSFVFSACKKRKKLEIVIASDHQGLDIFDIRSTRTVTSYAIPPTETFACAPISVTSKAGRGKDQERFTYWITNSDLSAQVSGVGLKSKLICLHETSQKSSIYTKIIPGSKAPFLDVFKFSEQESHCVLVLTADQRFFAYSHELENTKIDGILALKEDATAKSSEEDPGHVELLETTTVGEARRSFLRAREDVITSISGPEGLADDYTIASVISVKSSGTVCVHLFLLAGSITHLLTNTLPETTTLPGQGSWAFHVKSGKLFKYADSASSSMQIYDLNTIIPQLESSLALAHAQSVLRVSPSTVIIAAQQKLEILDLKWQSIQDSGPLFVGSGNEKGDLAPTRLIGYYASLSIAIGLQGSFLLAYKLNDDDSHPHPPRRSSRKGTLADAIGRGVGLTAIKPNATGSRNLGKALGKKMVPKSSPESSAQIERHFDPLLASESVLTYDEAMLKSLQAITDHKGSRPFPYGHAIQPDLIAYAICALFNFQKPRESDPSRLMVNRMAPETFRFLLTHGLLNIGLVEKALRSRNRMAIADALPQTAIISALIDHDSSLQALIYYLSSAPVLLPMETSFGLLVSLKAVQRFEGSSDASARTNGEPQKVLSDGREDMYRDQEMTSDSQHLVHSSENGDFEDDWPDPDPNEHHLHNARSALGSCLARMSLCNDRDVRNALRAIMTTSELLTLIDYIRMELSSGGWLARYLDEDLQGESDISMQSNQVNVAAKILNCAIDSLGTTSWLLNSAENAYAAKHADKVAYMRAEINATLEGVENSAFLESMLREVLLYANSTGNVGPPASGNEGDIIARTDASQAREQTMLPLAMKADSIPRTRSTAGGKDVRRSARDIGLLKSKKVPEYSFERIAI